MAIIDDITNLYVGYFNRAPDPAGLNFWVAQRNAGASLAGIADSFSKVPEAQNLYGFLSAPLVGSAASFLSSVYLNLFNRVANATTDPTGFAYWTAQLTNPAIPVGRVIVDIISGAQGADAMVVANKSLVGKTFAQNILDNNATFNSALAAAAFTGVTSDAATATAKIATNLTAILGSAGSAGGQSFTLTTGADNLTGGAANDTFNGFIGATGSTLTGSDIVNGGGGNDTFALTTDNTGTLTAASFNSIEIFSIRDVGAAATYDFSTVVGENSVINNRSTSAVVFNNIAAGSTLTIQGDANVTHGNTTFKMAAATDAVTINVDGGVKGGNITRNDTGLAAVTVNSTGAANTIGTLDVDTATAVKSLTINAAQSLTATLAADYAAGSTLTISGAGALVNLSGAGLSANFVSVNASGLTAGGASVILGAATTAFTGGAGNDTVSITNLVFNSTTKVDAGAGTGDVLSIADATALAAATVPNLLGFETLRTVDDADADTYTISLLTSLTGLQLDTNDDVEIYNGISAAIAGNIAIRGNQAANQYNITGATTVNQIDTLAFNIVDTDATAAVSTATMANINAAGAEIINFAATGNLTVTSLNLAGALTSSTITGSGIVNIATGNLVLNVNTTINAAAATGAFTFNAATAQTNGIGVTGSATAANVLTGTAQADVLTGGAANDTFTGANGIDTINLGSAGDDIVVLDGIVAAANRDVVTGFTANNTAFVTGNGVDRLEMNDAQATFAFTATSGTLQTTTAAGAVTFNTAAANVLELAFELAGGNGGATDLDVGTDGTNLLAANGAITVAANTNAGYIVAYQDGKGYLYQVTEGADGDTGQVAAADVNLVGVFNGVAVGGFAATNFIDAA